MFFRYFRRKTTKIIARNVLFLQYYAYFRSKITNFNKITPYDKRVLGKELPFYS